MDMQRVELDEDEDRADLAAPTGPDDELAATARRPRRSRRGAVLLGAGALLVVGSLVGAQAVLDARERRAVAALQDVDGVVPPVGDRMTAAFSIANPLAFEAVDDLLMTVAAEPDGRQRVAVHSAQDGRELWSAPIGTARTSDDAVLARPPCATGTSSAWGDVVLCLDTDGSVRWGDTGELERDEATYARLLVLGLADGTEHVRRDLAPDVRDVVLLDDLLVTAREGAGQVLLVASDVDGTVRWRKRLADGGAGAAGAGPISLSIAGGGVWVDGSSGSPLGLVTREGEVLARAVGNRWSSDEQSLLLTTSRGSATQTRVVRDAAVVATVEGDPVSATVDDGSLGDVLLTHDEGLTLWDVATGERRWVVPEGDDDGSDSYRRTASGSMVLRGVVYVWDDAVIRAFAGSDGRLLWTDAPPGSSVAEVLTDGRRLLVSPQFEEGSDTVMSLRALTLDGEPAGRVELPSGLRWTTSFEGMFWGVREGNGEYDVVALR
ncbi:hypothetical protein [Cellulomonas sp. PSBB021]|uniref:hypothetical protein n=1 Tax=Cellulomonas sp. PSBB021 TaxID=2003551 RepID=UPI000B8D9BA1|nr:hypothetical protein [Cellulomonas sp. PSBB021]ASR55438.1 hypothetical protein CBP52_10445 [Cellulomonas sp. PSBB021]